MSAFDTVVHLIYLACATAFVVGLHLMNAPRTARRGNLVSAAGMGVAILVTLAVLIEGQQINAYAAWALGLGTAAGAVAGLVAARVVRMTAMPQLVSLFNAVGGGAAALIALGDHPASTQAEVTGVLDVLIGALTFSGSLIASGKLAGRVPGRPIVVPYGRLISIALAAVAAVMAVLVVGFDGGTAALVGAAGAALVAGVLLTLPIGGADMPVVISLLNACTGTAVAMAGFVLGSTPLIIAGALVGAAGAILTKLMADAMNRPISAIIAGGYGTGDAVAVEAGGGSAAVREITADDAAIQLAYAGKVVIVPGYGLAAAQAQHEAVALAQALAAHGVEVSYAIHPVAGRMPGHMNVLLAEANAPYEQLQDLEESNPAFPRTDVALVIGANDVTNPAARRPGNAVSGMPILDVDKARSVIVIKRSLGHGYAGIDNELYSDPRTAMLFADAKQGLNALLTGLSAYAS
ncbi:NAD(P)(+) transhydrogenase (Re/Si-specific) subunit beta [Paractinoplanes brasiliensis]|uniref:NAD(P) transhydrogenase subunit beta n=1 Tax=Paractinoplanes brasiliensis TaxID=52695 RepID=A0A4V3C604_9ACTN|nr:NAD(P)(+) transhydrogenase (Re/Si-specific) subunit beta [Actinoplanes brasiliensis]TDO31848.1 NAD/NADP transhydrogenase beta subunit [Actinoplanes brasiliensis]GID30553.1 NAD(P) transhydrogenase subunit beta [Actinoplanes brasiliensis]